MTQRIQVLLVDDLDGSPAEETVSFSLDGVSYEIDLTAPHAAEMREAMAQWIASSRRAGGRTSRGRGRRQGADNQVSVIRAWALANGYQISDRGRVSAEIREAYAKVH
jgi:hypothetical protein